MDKNKISIRILGEEHYLITTDSPEYVEKVAKMVDDRMNTILKSNSALSHRRIAVLVALNLADDLTKALNDIDELKAKNVKPKVEITETKNKVIEMTKKINESEELYTNVLNEFAKVKKTRNKQETMIHELTNRLEIMCEEIVGGDEALKNASAKIALLEKKLALRESEISEYIKVFDELENKQLQENEFYAEEEFLELDDFENEIIIEGEIEE